MTVAHEATVAKEPNGIAEKWQQWELSIWWHKSTQVSFCLSYLLNAKKDRTMFVSTCVTKWKAPNTSIYVNNRLNMPFLERILFWKHNKYIQALLNIYILNIYIHRCVCVCVCVCVYIIFLSSLAHTNSYW